MEFHEIANVFPLMEGEEFRALVKDIAKHGQRQPILTYEGKVLDGRNRYRACVEADVEPWVEHWSGGSPVEAVLSLNLHRRHLSSGQRAAIATRMLPHLEAEAKKRKTGRPKTGEKVSQRIDRVSVEGRAATEAAKLTGTNRQYVSDAKKLQTKDPEAFEAVERGEISLPAASKKLKPPETPLKGEDRRPVKEMLGEDFNLPPWNLPPERKEYANVVKNLVRLSRLDPETVASYCKGEYEAERDLEHVAGLTDWLTRYEIALKKKCAEFRPGNLRAVN